MVLKIGIFFKILLTFIYLLFSSVVYADSHDAQQNIVEKAKEINQKIKKDQSKQIMQKNLN